MSKEKEIQTEIELTEEKEKEEREKAKPLTGTFFAKHFQMLDDLKKFYRAESNSHLLRLIIEDAWKDKIEGGIPG